MENRNLIPNSTQIPNIISDFIYPFIPEAEMRCLHYICRRTYGFHKEMDRISLTQFISGIVSRDGKRLDRGAGLSRPSVVEALRNLVGADLVQKVETKKGNYYRVNLEIFDNTEDIEMAINEVVKKVNQLRKLTKSGKASLPKAVKLLNLQKKGKQSETKYIAEVNSAPSIFNLKDELNKLKASPQKHIQLIGEYLEEKNIPIESKEQLEIAKGRHLRDASKLAKFSDKQIGDATIKAEKEYPDYTLGTLVKILTR